MVYELWHKPSKNAVDFYSDAVTAERYIAEIAAAYGEDAVADYCLIVSDEDEAADERAADRTMDGPDLLAGIRRLAALERAGKVESAAGE